jgi:superfamily I DNA and/or RNA helicase/very-short-patch-repair endonuclease
MKSVAEKLEISRKELLDIGIRGNSLLHFVPRSMSISIFDEKSVELFKILVESKRSMTFAPIPKSLQQRLDSNEEELEEIKIIEQELGEKRHTDNKLQTKLNSDLLDRKLLKINSNAEAYFQEQGIDILYLALGFLHWYEDDNSDLVRKAPLILIPVALKRISAQERFRINYTGVDLNTNLTLQAKLKTDFLIDLPEFNEDVEVGDYFKTVRKQIKKRNRWTVNDDEIHLGFFKFGKFQMYKDLDEKNWSEDEKPSSHPIIKKLFGEGFWGTNEFGTMTEEEFADELIQFDVFNFISDADSSQSEAILKVKQGINLVIQGPPGTGKSQTITNIISETLSEGRKILFVSEKMAALEVVKSRLDRCNLGDTVLELHSHKSNKKLVLQELKRTLDLGTPKVEDHTISIKRYNDLKEHLDDYVKEVKKKIYNSGFDFVTAVGKYYQYKIELEELNIEDQVETDLKWTQEEFTRKHQIIQDLVDHLKAYGSPISNPFINSTLRSISPKEKDLIYTQLNKIIGSLDGLINETERLNSFASLPMDKTFDELNKFKNAFIKCSSIPELNDIDFNSNKWCDDNNIILQLLENGEKSTALEKKLRVKLIDSTFEKDIESLYVKLKYFNDKWWRIFSSDYRSSNQALKLLYKSDIPNNKERFKDLTDLYELQSLKKHVDHHSKLGKKLFGQNWTEKEDKWDYLKCTYHWLKEYHLAIKEGQIANSFTANLAKINYQTDFESEIIRFDQLNKEFNQANTKLEQILKIKEGYKFIDTVDKQLNDLLNEYQLALDKIEQIDEHIRFNQLSDDFINDNLPITLGTAKTWEYNPDLLLIYFSFKWFESLVDFAYKKRPSLSHFDRAAHEKKIKEFRDLDEKLSRFSQETLIVQHHKSLPSLNAGGEIATILREINKKRRHLPIRQLLKHAGRAIQQIKPVFMMSPMSVATFASPGALDFDLVIFDEASQVKVVDALIPILRGKQIVVVGDSKQMPPTDFFNKMYEGDEESEEESLTTDIESILSMFLSQGAKESMLRWHYRSKHDSLIAVSNHEFYENKLKIFPSSGQNAYATGLNFIHVPNSIYERGSSRTNPIEARKLAEHVIEHAKNYPNLSLGVVAFSVAQRDCITLELDMIRRKNPETESFFNQNNTEPFFIKNLENVQGDERDMIYISIGYGKTATGNLPKSFGPVNRDGGERRLNVLITRSRLAMHVFSNFTADDLETNATTPFGVRALKNFLKYAREGELLQEIETERETDSPFEDEVIAAIRKLGYEVEPQVGSAGFYIDAAIKDPKFPGRYMLAVECDGASYHSSRSARDRDRLRQSVLESLGWRFYRIWSTDWFRSPEKENSKT